MPEYFTLFSNYMYDVWWIWFYHTIMNNENRVQIAHITVVYRRFSSPCGPQSDRVTSWIDNGCAHSTRRLNNCQNCLIPRGLTENSIKTKGNGYIDYLVLFHDECWIKKTDSFVSTIKFPILIKQHIYEPGPRLPRYHSSFVVILWLKYYRQVSKTRRTLVGNWIVDHPDVVWASPVGAAPTTSSFTS